MHNSTNEQAVKLIKWGERCLYVLLFVFMTVSMFNWNYPPTLPYLGAILTLFYLQRIWERHGKGQSSRLETDVHKCALEYINEHPRS